MRSGRSPTIRSLIVSAFMGYSSARGIVEGADALKGGDEVEDAWGRPEIAPPTHERRHLVVAFGTYAEQIAGKLAAEALVGAMVDLEFDLGIGLIADPAAVAGGAELGDASRAVPPPAAGDVGLVVHDSLLGYSV